MHIVFKVGANGSFRQGILSVSTGHTVCFSWGNCLFRHAEHFVSPRGTFCFSVRNISFCRLKTECCAGVNKGHKKTYPSLRWCVNLGKSLYLYFSRLTGIRFNCSCSSGTRRCLWSFPDGLLRSPSPPSDSCRQGICEVSTCGPAFACLAAGRRDEYWKPRC